MKTTRRAVIAGAAAVAPLTGIGALAGVEADPVIALCRRWHDMEAEITAASRRDDLSDAKLDALSDRLCELCGEIAAMPARSLAGIAAKLRVAASYVQSVHGDDPEDQVLLSTFEDAERLIAG